MYVLARLVALENSILMPPKKGDVSVTRKIAEERPRALWRGGTTRDATESCSTASFHRGDRKRSSPKASAGSEALALKRLNASRTIGTSRHESPPFGARLERW